MRLRPVDEYDHEFLYDLLKDRPAYAAISHKGMPTYEQHCAFVHSRPYDHWYIIEANDGESCGSVYLTPRDEIGVHVLSSCRGRGFGRAAVVELMRKHPRQRFLANIAPSNDGSLRFFADLGFRLIQHTLEKECQ